MPAMMPSRGKSALTEVKRSPLATRDLFERLAGGPLAGWDAFAREVGTRHLAPGGTVFMQGAEHGYAYVVAQGLIKNVYVSDSGEEWIKSFSQEGQFFGSMAAFEPGGRTSFAAVAIEPT